MIRINELKLPLDEDEQELYRLAAKALKIGERHIRELTICKNIRSISAGFIRSVGRPFNFQYFRYLTLRIPVVITNKLHFFSQHNKYLHTCTFILFII